MRRKFVVFFLSILDEPILGNLELLGVSLYYPFAFLGRTRQVLPHGKRPGYTGLRARIQEQQAEGLSRHYRLRF